MRTLPKLALLALLSIPAAAAAADPAGWFLAGSDPSSYAIARDVSVMRLGKASGRLASTRVSTVPRGFGTMMQMFDAGDYRGKRLRLSAWVKARDVRDWAGVWMRVDPVNRVDFSRTPSLAFDNMQNRPIRGTKEWTRCDIVLDVTDEAGAIAFGILLSGPGTVWMNDVRFEVVDKSVPVTSSMTNYKQLKQPMNLDFGQ